MLFDVNDHPLQDKVNEELGAILADTINKLRTLCKKYNLEASSTAIQFRDSFNLIMKKEFRKEK